ncbi:efflux RND transporter periplasmic adaptor subunit [Enterobacillus tribolii]|uniref:Cu(I)/Ag(I) efflux system membrane fusion protein n=1 Tax=Enterobacillus tribolii TaxID=1487935 RepID=A0A370QHL3_9GAMM|nr:efflux RND transporter periplasmic adaptor subunit [Enterobacillus tribolii]MBW7982548.1 efflux RND transporter periplasmic adaptor subunit [Enterobacillus tribolii]RDK87828.1 Cu(I)/Ag(I) efflux system membrane fusion protein [Enterobacillus tribolii]
MKKNLALSALALALLAAGWIGYQWGQRSAVHDVPPAAADGQRKVLYWYDPMVPGQRFDKPGKSPFMDMELVPRYADEESSDSGVTISARQQQNLGIKTAAAEMRTLSQNLAAYGTVAVNERLLKTLSSPSAGVIEQLRVKAPQQAVRAGETLAVIWNPTWSGAQQEYLGVRQTGDAALTRAARQRLALLFMPEDVIRRVERSGQVQPRMEIRAPQEGYISKLEVREGQQITPAQPLFELAALDQVWVVIDYPQSQANRIKIGDRVTASANALPGVTFDGTVSELLPELDATTRNLRARIVLQNPQQQLKPGMYLTVSAASHQARRVLSIPRQALITTGEHSRVLLSDGNGHFTPVNVRTGESQGEWTEILDGLKEGQQVVTSGQFLIDSEASLRNALPQFSGGQEKPPAEKAAQQQYSIMGTLKAQDGETLTISHEPIPELKWGKMTMDFTLPGGKLPADVQPGSRIHFSFTMDENGIVITHIMPAGNGAQGGHP